MTVEVVIPWCGGCQHRERALSWVRGRYPWLVTIARAPDGPWCKALAVMPAISRSTADVVVVADADVWTAGLEQAVQAVADGAPWAIPHHTVHRLTQAATAQVLAGVPPAGQELSERPYKGVPGGGTIVAHREMFEAVPMDPRFVGWGCEDESWALALTCLYGSAWRGDADLWHLWHPPQRRDSRRIGSQQSWRLRRRYFRARRDPREMRRLLAEVHDALAALKPAGHDQAA